MVFIAFSISGCGAGGGSPESKTGALVPGSISINPATAVIVSKGLTTQFTATATYRDQSTADISSKVSWTSSNPLVATIDKNGLVAGITVGDVTVSATAYGLSTASVSVKVTTAKLQVITISASKNPIAKGLPVTFTAIGTYSDSSAGNVSGSVTWTSSNTGIATVNTSGIATTLAVGNTTITATSVANGITVTGSTSLSVSAAELTNIAINPVNATVSSGLTTNFTAQGTYTDASKADLTTKATWATANSAIATITNVGVAKGLTAGSSTTVTAALGGITSPAVTLTVSAGIITSVTISPATQTVPKGIAATYTAMASYSDNSQPANISGAVAWTSKNTTIATLNGSGIASTLAQGSAVISATILVGQIW